MRDTVIVALEKACAAKIGSSLEASVLLHVPEPTFQVGGPPLPPRPGYKVLQRLGQATVWTDEGLGYA